MNYTPYIVSLCIFLCSMGTILITKTSDKLNNFSLGIICGLSIFHLLPDSNVNILTAISFYIGYLFSNYFHILKEKTSPEKNSQDSTSYYSLNETSIRYELLYIELSLIFHSIIIGLNYTNYIYGCAIGFHQIFEIISINSLYTEKKYKWVRTIFLSISIPIGIILSQENICIDTTIRSYLNMFISGSLLAGSFRTNIYNQLGILVMLLLGFVC